MHATNTAKMWHQNGTHVESTLGKNVCGGLGGVFFTDNTKPTVLDTESNLPTVNTPTVKTQKNIRTSSADI